ncbi:MAG: MOSC domain-containing protein [Candidatus Sumerlaeia bacterium]|nr:MOSC domain-containing protein [Candidatus Sumerlaeia bacterium]
MVPALMQGDNTGTRILEGLFMIIGRILSVHVGKAAELRGKPGKKSAIDKRPVQGAVALGRFGFEGDVQVDRRYHGGPFKAVCAYCSHNHRYWEESYGVTMPPGSFGENIHLEGGDDGEVCLGDLIGVGDVRLRISGPRGPCSNLGAHWGLKDLHLRAKKERKTGYYLSVEEQGVVEAGTDLVLLDRPHPEWTITSIWNVLDGPVPSVEEIRSLQENPFLDEDWAPNLRSLLRRADKNAAT